MAIESTTIITLYDDAAKTKAFAPRTKVEAISNNSGTGLQALLDAKLALTGGTMTGHITFAGGTAQNAIKGLKWTSVNSKNPYIGYATDQTDGTFVISSLLGTNYASGLAISGGSGNLLYKGAVVLHADNWSNYAAAASHNHAASAITSGTLSSDRLPTVPISKGGTGATSAAGALTNLGLTATAAELNYCDGVTSNIQTQLNGKASSSHSHSYIPLSGGTLSSSSAQISRGGSSTFWHLGRSNAMLKISSYSGYNAITSMKTTSGDWSMGVHTNNKMYFTYVTDTNYNAGTNSPSGQIVFGPWGTMYKGAGSLGVPGVFIQSSTPSAIQTGDIWFVT